MGYGYRCWYGFFNPWIFKKPCNRVLQSRPFGFHLKFIWLSFGIRFETRQDRQAAQVRSIPKWPFNSDRELHFNRNEILVGTCSCWSFNKRRPAFIFFWRDTFPCPLCYTPFDIIATQKQILQERLRDTVRKKAVKRSKSPVSEKPEVPCNIAVVSRFPYKVLPKRLNMSWREFFTHPVH